MNINAKGNNIKNIRAMLKSQHLINDSDIISRKIIIENDTDRSLSFNVTPEEEDIKRNLLTIDICEGKYIFILDKPLINNIEKESMKYRNEAERLIQNTKKMMESFEINKSEILSTKRVTESSYFNTIYDDKPLETKSVISEKVTSSKVNDRLLEKVKIIKSLEKELKEKNALIDRLNNKLYKQNDDINKLKEKLNVYSVK